MLPDWCEVFERLNPGSFAYVQTDEDGHFISLTVIPGVCLRWVMLGGMRMSQADCAFMKARMYKGQLMALVGMDGNGKIVTVGITICPTVNTPFP
jgi:hypothetical protein